VSKIRVTVWNEGIHEKKSEKVRGVYPEGIHGAIAGHLRKQAGIEVVATATLEEPEHGLTEAVLANACHWAARREGSPMKPGCTQCKEPLNPIRPRQEGQAGKPANG